MGVKPSSPILKDVETLLLPLPLSGCQLRLQHQLHLWRTLLEDDLDLCPDLPRAFSQRCRSLQPEKSEPAVEEPMERGFFRFQCYGTCSAAAFASTTSCTFGGLFWRTTLTCAQIFPVLAANQG